MAKPRFYRVGPLEIPEEDALMLAFGLAVAVGGIVLLFARPGAKAADSASDLPSPEEIRQRLIAAEPPPWLEQVGMTPGEWAAAQITGAQMEGF